MTVRTAVEDEFVHRSECWCCGMIEASERMVHLGNHPEVALCIRCAHFVHRQAWQIEDLSKTGRMVRGRDALRRVRSNVSHRAWHRKPIIGPVFRWLGKRMP